MPDDSRCQDKEAEEGLCESGLENTSIHHRHHHVQTHTAMTPQSQGTHNHILGGSNVPHNDTHEAVLLQKDRESHRECVERLLREDG